MTSRERVIATLTFSRPDRPPRDLWVLPYVQLFRKQELDEVLARYPGDISRPELSPGSDDEDLRKLARPGHYTDEWGSGWHVAEPGVIGEVKHPAVGDWSRLRTFRPPWQFLRSRDWDHVNRMCERGETFSVSGVCARPFERLQFLRGSEQLYMDLAEESSQLRSLITMVHEYYCEDVAAWARSNVDAVSLMDDWGSNTGLLISPKTWRAVFKPLYRDYCEIVRKAGKFVFFHSDGNIEPIYGDFVELGIHAINSQLFCMNIERLGRMYRGRITFWGEIDRQQVLPYGSPSQVRDAVLRVRRALEDPAGGVIAQCEWGKDNRRENVEAVFEAWEEPVGSLKD
jgi:hypothetical protein